MAKTFNVAVGDGARKRGPAVGAECVVAEQVSLRGLDVLEGALLLGE